MIQCGVDDMLILKDVYKGYTFDLDKAVSPKETIKRFKERVKKAGLDILDRTIRVDNGRLGIPVYVSICGKDAREIIGSRKQMGKGGTPEQAEASAIMELAERFSLFSFLKRDFIKKSYEEVKEKAISYQDIARSVHDRGEAERVCPVFSRLSLRWSPAYDLTDKEEILIPIDWFFMINQYNGSSSGNCNEEAILQGICEVIERHVSDVVSSKRINVPSVDISDLRDPLAKELVEKYKKAGIRLYINDFSLDTGIPTISVIAYDPTTFPKLSEIVWTAGTTTNPEKSLIRALTEVAQLAGDFNTGSCYDPSGLPKPKSLEEISYLIGSEEKIHIQDLPDISDEDIKKEIENAIDVLKKDGFRVITVDITHPSLEIPAFYNIIPGTHFRQRAKAGMGMFLSRIVVENYDPFSALKILKEIEAILPSRYYISFYIGMIFMKLGNMDSAIEYFKRALELEPDQQDIPTIYSYLAYCLKEQEKYKEAIDVLNKAEEYDSERTDIYNLKGFCYFKLRDYKRAISCFEKVIRIDPGSAIDYANIGVNYERLGEKEKAIEYYTIALKLDPGIDFARNNLSRLMEEYVSN